MKTPVRLGPSALVFIIVSVSIAVFTFPGINPVYANGIDPPLSWVFNFLIQGRLQLGRDIIFPHGPLAFLMYPLPTGQNLVVAIVVYFVLRVTFAYSVLRLTREKSWLSFITGISSAILLLALLDILLVITGLVILGFIHFTLDKKPVWLLLSILLTVFAIYIKAFVGIVCLVTTIVFFAMATIRILTGKERARILLFGFLIPLLLILLWAVMYGSLTGFIRYFVGMKELAGDNSTAVAYYPENNWWALGSAGLLAVSIIIQQWHCRLCRFYMILTAPALFAVWKYGMAREDYLHAGMWFLFVLMVTVFLFLVIKVRKWSFSLTALLILGFLFANLRNAYYFEMPRFSYTGLRTIGGLIRNYIYISDTSNDASCRNIQRNRLDSAIKARIGSATVDIYPWDYTYIPANGLNWRPRPVLQSYACYTPWLDQLNAVHFWSGSAPEYLIWELRKITHDIHDGTLEGIDGRYLLNDQPETILAILARYRLYMKQPGVFQALILKKREEPLEVKRETVRKEVAFWNRWIDVKGATGDLVRLKAVMKRNAAGDLKSFFYKDEACYIYYLLDNDEIRVYRLVPKNASEGIWINPLIIDAEDRIREPYVRKIQFRCTRPALMDKTILLEWEKVYFRGDSISAISSADVVNRFFGKVESDPHASVFSVTNDLESDHKWFSANPDPVMADYSFSGQSCCRVAAESFSFSFEAPLDSILSGSNDSCWLIRADVWAFSSKVTEASLVISLEEDHKPLNYRAVRLNDFLLDRKEWNYVINFLQFSRKEMTGKKLFLKVYVWNQGKNDLLIDDMRIRITPR